MGRTHSVYPALKNMSKLDQIVYGQILKKDFPLDNYDLTDLVDIAWEVNDIADKKQEIIGKILLSAYKKNGFKILDHFARILNIPYPTIESYFQVTNTIKDLDIPVEFNWSLRKEIAHAKNPKEALEKAVKGLSRIDLLNMKQKGGDI